MGLRIAQKEKEKIVPLMMDHQAWTLMVSLNPTGIRYGLDPCDFMDVLTCEFMFRLLTTSMR